jgi:hypothetical protein
MVMADPAMEDQVTPQDTKLLKIRSDVRGVRVLAPLTFFFLLVGLRGRAVFRLGHATSKRPRRQDANYQSLGAGNGAEPPAVGGVEKSAGKMIEGAAGYRCCNFPAMKIAARAIKTIRPIVSKSPASAPGRMPTNSPASDLWPVG